MRDNKFILYVCFDITYFLVPSSEPPRPDQPCTSVQLMGFTWWTKTTL